MTDDRSREERLVHSTSEGVAAREPWYERLLHLFHLRAKESVRDDIEDALAETGDGADVSPQERAMLKNVLELHRVRVDDVMVPRGDIVAVTLEATVRDVLRVFRTAGHSRLPVYRDTIDDAKGMIHIRDFLAFLAAQSDGVEAETCTLDLSKRLEELDLVRPVLFAPPSMPVIDLLVRMQATHTHMALVVDEYGGTDGLLSIEDLIERVVGDIEDEHDVDASLALQRVDARTFLADARTRLEKVSEALGLDLVNQDIAEDIDTIGGLITTLSGRVPSGGEIIAGPEGLTFEVLDGDLRRLKRVRILLPEPAAEFPGSLEHQFPDPVADGAPKSDRSPA